MSAINIKIPSFFQSLFSSLTELSFYKQISSNRISQSIRYILLMTLLVQPVDFAFFYKSISIRLTDVTNTLAAGMPPLVFTDGKLGLADGSSSAVIYQDSFNDFRIVYDQAGDTAQLQEKTGLLLSPQKYTISHAVADQIMLHESLWADEKEAFQLLPQWPRIDSSNIGEYTASIKPQMLYVLYMVSYIMHFISYMIMVTLTSLFTLTHANIIKHKINKRAAFNISVYALTSWAILSLIFKQLGIYQLPLLSMLPYISTLALVYLALNHLSKGHSNNIEA